MKTLIVLIPVLLFGNLLLAQDVIVKKNGDEIESKVLEITTETIKYKEFTFQDGPIRNIKISDVFMIIYENGKREVLNKASNQPQEKEKIGWEIKDQFLFGPGYGRSYGGWGLRFQWRKAKFKRFAGHLGLGYYQDFLNPTVGSKFFISKNIYLNSQFGFTGSETFPTYDYNVSSGQLTLVATDTYRSFGYSFLVGGDWSWDVSNKVGIGLNAALGWTHNFMPRGYDYLAWDIGFIVRFSN